MRFEVEARELHRVDVLVAGGGPANLLAGRVIAAAGYVPVFCVIAFCHLTAFCVLLATSRSQRNTKTR